MDDPNGHFLILEKSSFANYDTPAELTSPTLEMTSPLCKLRITFHHQYCNDAQLYVIIYKLIGFTWQLIEQMPINPLTGNRWNTVTIPVGGLSSGHKVKISAKCHDDGSDGFKVNFMIIKSYW